MKGELTLLPNLLGKELDTTLWLAPIVHQAVATLDGLIAESHPGGRRYLYKFKTKRPPNDIPIALLPKKVTPADLDFLLEPLLKGEHWGLVSDAGLPSLADPGAELILRAKSKRITIRALPGPSSITAALLLSGLNANRFSFHGYLARERDAHLRNLEERSRTDKATQLFIEAPYRNEETLKVALTTLSKTTLLCIATNLTLPNEQVTTQTIRQWQQQPFPALNDQPSVFLLQTPGG